MIIYSLDILLSQFGTSPFVHVWFQLLLLDLHTVLYEADRVVYHLFMPSHHFHLFKNFPVFL